MPVHKSIGPSARALLAASCLAVAYASPLLLLANAQAQVGIDVSVTVAPPLLPDYDQPPLPGPGYIWTPGYWAYGDAGYYWVPGTWVEPPAVGLLWTPGYWAFEGARYLFHAGYWGPHVGFYGGVDYGFGYTGDGYFGGEWRNGAFSYNRAVNNFGNLHITNVYDRTVVRNVTVNRVSFNGPGGVTRQPTPQEAGYARERHVEATSAQTQQREMAARQPDLRASVNHGKPPVAATPRAGELPNRAEEQGGKPDTSHSAETNPSHQPAAKAGREAERSAAQHPGEPAQMRQEHAAQGEKTPAEAERRAAAESKPRPETHTAAAPHAPAQRPATEARAPERRPTDEARAPEQQPAAEARAPGRSERASVARAPVPERAAAPQEHRAAEPAVAHRAEPHAAAPHPAPHAEHGPDNKRQR